MAGIKHKLVVMSGKGGVGKSMTTVNLALAFARQGAKVGLLDVDLNGPCVPRMLGLHGQSLTMGPEGAIPPVGPLGVKVASMDFFLEDASPVRWKGPMDVSPVWLGLMEMNVIREFLADVVWGELDYLLADLPPGAAADKPPVIAGFIPDLAGAIVVTTPSEVASDVVQKSVTYARDMGIKVMGIVENMSEYRCPSCGEVNELSTAIPRRCVRCWTCRCSDEFPSTGNWRAPSTRERHCSTKRIRRFNDTKKLPGASRRCWITKKCLPITCDVTPQQDAEKVHQHRSRIAQRLNVPNRASRMSELLEGLSRSPRII